MSHEEEIPCCAECGKAFIEPLGAYLCSCSFGYALTCSSKCADLFAKKINEVKESTDDPTT